MRRHLSHLGGHAVPLAADDQHRPLVRAVGVEIRAAQLRRHNRVAPRLHLLQRRGQISRAPDRHAEDGAHRRAQRLGAVEISARARQQRAVKARCVRRAQDGAHVAGVLHAVHRHDQAAGKALRLLRNPHRAADALRGLLLADRLHDRRRYQQHLAAGRLCRPDQLRKHLPAAFVHNQRAAKPERDRLAHHLDALRQKEARLPAALRLLQLAQPLHLRIVNARDLLHAPCRLPQTVQYRYCIAKRSQAQAKSGPKPAFSIDHDLALGQAGENLHLAVRHHADLHLAVFAALHLHKPVIAVLFERLAGQQQRV